MTKLIESHPELDQIIREFKTETVAEEALRILEPIPEEKWCIYTRRNDQGKCCALGHYSMKKYGHPASDAGEDGPFTLKLIKQSRIFLGLIFLGLNVNASIATVNNGEHRLYSQPTPKQRTIALLQDMIKAGY